MVAVKAGFIGPQADGTTPFQNPLDVRRVETFLALGGRSGLLSGFFYTVVAGQMQLSFPPGEALIAERDGSNNELRRGYLLWSDTTVIAQFGAASAAARNDAVVMAVVDVEDGAQGTGAIGVGGHIVVVPGVSGTTTPRTDAQIQTYLGRGGFHRYADVAIPAGSTQISAGNVALTRVRLNSSAKRIYAHKTADEGLVSSTTVQDDNSLFLDLPVGVWDITLKLSAFCSSGIAADIKMMWTFSGTFTGSPGRFCLGPAVVNTGVSDTTVRLALHSLALEVTYGVDDVVGNYISENLFLVVTAPGRLQLRWAQAGSSSSTTTVLTGSRLVAESVD
jgi:hypothetical protein